MEKIKLNNGIEMPQIGYGVYLVTPDECERCVSDALSVGYRSIDTAQAYYNEEGVGLALEKSGISRNEIFLTTKVWINRDGGEDWAARSIDESLRKLRTDYIDLLLVHQPIGDYYATWRAMEKAVKEGKVRALGVSNFYPDQFVDFAENQEIVPAVNQLRTNIFSQQWDQEKELAKYGTKIVAWAPIAQASEKLFASQLIKSICDRTGKTAAQVALRYLIQRGIIVIPKSTRIERMRENLDVLDFALTDAEMESMKALDTPEAFEMSHRDPQLIRFLLGYDQQFNPARKK